MKLDEVLITRLIDRIESGNTFILKEIGKTIGMIRNLTPTKAYQLQQMIKYGASYQTIIQRLSKITNINVNEIDEIFNAYAKKDYQFAKKFYDYKGIEYIPFEKFTLLNQQVKALSNITKIAYTNISNTSALGFTIRDAFGNVKFKNIGDAYQYAVDQAILSISQGKDTFDHQMHSILKDLGEGVKTIDYASGRTRRLDSALRMNLMGGLRDLHNETQKIIGESFGADMVEISVHSHPAPDHYVQGHQFLIEEYKKLQNGGEAKDLKGKIYTLDHDNNGTYRPISEYNCYHTIFYGIAGVNKPQYNEEELQRIINKNDYGFTFENKHYSLYDGEQLLRNIELNLRKNKDIQILGREAKNEMLVNDAQYKITQLTNKYRKILKASELRSKLERARVPNYHKVNTSNLNK